jgi:hypothetical protein
VKATSWRSLKSAVFTIDTNAARRDRGARLQSDRASDHENQLPTVHPQ